MLILMLTVLTLQEVNCLSRVFALQSNVKIGRSMIFSRDILLW